MHHGQPIRSQTVTMVDGHDKRLDAYSGTHGWWLRLLSNGVVTRTSHASRWEQVERAFALFDLRNAKSPPLST